MAYRCEDCGKLCGVEEEDPEVSGEEVDNEGNVTGEVHIQLVSTCCSSQLDGAEADIEFEASVEVAHKFAPEDECSKCYVTFTDHNDDFWPTEPKIEPHEFEWDGNGHNLSVSVEVESDDWNEGTGGYRFQKHFWGASVSGTVTCDDCDASEEFSVEKVGVPAGDLNQFSGGSFSRNARAKKRRQAAQSAIVAESTANVDE